MRLKEEIDFFFLNIPLVEKTLQVYVPRKAILSAVKECSSQLNGTVLDVGCGQMPYRDLLIETNRNITNYIGLDLQTSSHPNKEADIYWDGKTIPMDANSVDSAMATEVLEHTFHPAATLQEINRVLKPGGTFFFTVPFIWPLHEVPYDAYRYTPFSLKMHLEQSGFHHINILSLGGWYASFAQMLGIWASEVKSTGFRKKIIVYLVRKTIPFLLKRDIRDHSFGNHCMMTGLYGTAVKKQSL